MFKVTTSSLPVLHKLQEFPCHRHGLGQASHYLYYYYNLLFVINSLILLKVCTEFIIILLPFMFCFLAMRCVGSYFPGQGSNPRPLHWKGKSSPLKHQGNPQIYFKVETLYHYNDIIGLMLFVYTC